MKVINRDNLPFIGVSYEFVGNEHGVVNSIVFLTAPPGEKIRLHRHDYDEIVLVQEGHAMFTFGDKHREVKAGT